MRLQHAWSVVLLVGCIHHGVLAGPNDERPSAPALEFGNDDQIVLPYFLRGKPEDQQAHTYRSRSALPHTASGEGLHEAMVGVPSSFAIQLVGEDGKKMNGPGILHSNWRLTQFIYVWIANEDQILIAEVEDSGNNDGILTATFTCDFPGEYLVHVEQVTRHTEGQRIAGSPFSLTVKGSAPTLDVNSLPVCDSSQDTRDGIEDTFWRTGTWISSNIASPAHGVARDGWVFQPKHCVFDTFSYDDIMLLASLKEEPTWLLVLGDSVHRGLFLSLVDMVLVKGQKRKIYSSAVQKCWGYADLRIGNLRLTYQDMRLSSFGKVEDSMVCNNEKLVSGSSSAFVASAREFLNSTVFREGSQWPSAILAPSNLRDTPGSQNAAINVLVEALPPKWEGRLLFAEHMAGFDYYWSQDNPTMTELSDVGFAFGMRRRSKDYGLATMDAYRKRDPRISFASIFPMYQAKLFENEHTILTGFRTYGSSQHFHTVFKGVGHPKAYNGERMVFSTITEMLANILLGRVVGTKAALYERAASAKHDSRRWSSDVGKTFEVCHDCPSSLVPFHVKPVPEPVCMAVESLPGDAKMGKVWDGKRCPGWCMDEPPVSQTPTESGPVDVRECRVGV